MTLPNPQRLTGEQQSILDLVISLAGDLPQRVWLVGGPLRDLQLGRTPADLDFTMENGTEDFAGRVATAFGGTLHRYPRFLTSKVFLASGTEIDFATTRSETYPAPGALPLVAASTIEHDLLRRDFSINAMALDLHDGELLDPSGGHADLARREIRILHPRSFIDDPTRLFRAIRLAKRLDFHLEPETSELADQAIRDGRIASLSRERIWRELILAIREPRGPVIVRTLLERELLRPILGPPLGPAAVEQRLSRIRSSEPASPGADLEVLALAAILFESEDPEPILESLPLSGRQRREAAALVDESEQFHLKLLEAPGPAERLRLCGRQSDSMLAFVRSWTAEAREIVEAYLRYRRLSLGFGGEALQVPPGPHVGRALQRTREAVFLEEIAPEEALSFAQREALQYLNETE